jgi:hypothetical protein
MLDIGRPGAPQGFYFRFDHNGDICINTHVARKASLSYVEKFTYPLLNSFYNNRVRKQLPESGICTDRFNVFDTRDISDIVVCIIVDVINVILELFHDIARAPSSSVADGDVFFRGGVVEWCCTAATIRRCRTW